MAEQAKSVSHGHNREKDENRVILEGWLSKRGSRLPTQKLWNRRYFVLRGKTLSYFMDQHDLKPKGTFQLSSECTVSDVYISEAKEKAAGDVNDSDLDIVASGIDYSSQEEQDLLRNNPPKKKRGRAKERLYCLKIRWPTGKDSKDCRETDDDASVVLQNHQSQSVRNFSHLEGQINDVNEGSYHDYEIRRSQSSSEVALYPSYSPIRQNSASGSEIQKSRTYSPTPSSFLTLQGKSISEPPVRRHTHAASPGVVRMPPITPNTLHREEDRRTFLSSSALSKRKSNHSNFLPLNASGAADVREEGLDYSSHSETGFGEVLPDSPTHENESSPASGAITTLVQTSPSSLISSERGIKKHYTEQLQAKNHLNQIQNEEMMRLMYLATKRAQYKKNKKRIINGSKYAAAAGAAVTAGVLTAGIGLAIGMVFVGITAAAGGSGAVAEATYRRNKGFTSLVVAATSFKQVRAWKTALEAAVDSGTLSENEDDTWAQLFLKEGRNAASCLLAKGNTIQRQAHQLDNNSHSNGQKPMLNEPHTRREDYKKNPKINAHFDQGISSRWIPLDGGWATLLGTNAQGLRIFREEEVTCDNPNMDLSARHMGQFFRRNKLSVDGRPCPPMKAQVILNSSPLNAFMCLMSHARVSKDSGFLCSSFQPNSGQRASFRIIDTLDDHMDIIHLFFRPLYLFPSWTSPRDFVLFRYWRFDEDGTYSVFYNSVQHPACPSFPGYVRGEMHDVYTIAPRKRSRKHRSVKFNSAATAQVEHDCLLTQTVQVDPRGWVPTLALPFLSNQSYAEAFAVSALLHVLDVRDALDNDRFVSVSLDHKPPTWKPAKDDFGRFNPLDSFSRPRTVSPISRTASVGTLDIHQKFHQTKSQESVDDDDDQINYDFKYSEYEVTDSISESSCGLQESIYSKPATLDRSMWAEPDANSFMVRSKTYKKDKKKENAGQSLFKLIAVDTFEVEAPLYNGVCTHPKERVQLALAIEKRLAAKGVSSNMPPFVVAVNIVLSGPPFYHQVFYYAVDDMSKIDGSDGTPSSKLNKEFFFGNSDSFRGKTFKLIPQIVEGNFIVRKAVGSTPAVMGTKLKQTYVRGERFFEIILDTGSSSIAAGVIRLCLGYAKSLVVDMAFLLEGNDESTLPERVLGCARLKNVDFGKNIRFVNNPVEVEN